MKVLIFSFVLLGALAVFGLQYVSSFAASGDRALYQRARLSKSHSGGKQTTLSTARKESAPSEVVEYLAKVGENTSNFVDALGANLLRPTSVSIRGLEALPPGIQSGLDGKIEKLSRGFVTPSKLHSIVKRSPWVESSSYSWSILPFRVAIEAVPAEPWIVAEFDSNSWLLSRKEKLLADLRVVSDSEIISRAGELPRLSGLEGSEGFRNFLSSENSRLRYACRLIHNIQRAQMIPFEVDRYQLEFDGSLLMHPLETNRPKILAKPVSMAQAKEMRKKVKAVLEDVAKRGEKIELLDLRFGSQVIVR